MHKREREDVTYEKITAIMSIIVMTVFCFTWIREVDFFTDSLNELVKDVTKNKEIYTWVQWVVCLMHLGVLLMRVGHLDWSDEGTKYLSQWKSAVNMWNDYKPGVIREDTGSTINDVEISDVYEKNNTNATTYWYTGIV